MTTITSEQVSSMTNDIKHMLWSANSNNDMEAISNGIKLCDRTLRKFRVLLKKVTNTGQKLHLETYIGHVIGYRKMFKALHVVGAGYTDPKRKVASRTGGHVASNRVQWVDQESAFKERMRTGLVINLTHKDVGPFLDDAFIMLRRRVNNILKTHEAIKLNAVFCGEFVVIKADKEIVEFKYFNSPITEIFRDTKLQEWLDVSLKPNIAKQLEEFQERDSGWALRKIINVCFHINKYNPQKHGGSSYIPLPCFIDKKKACVNVKNNDNACFAWAVMSALYPINKNSQLCSKYPDFREYLNLKDITFPMTIKQIPRFEDQNHISINVYILKKLNKRKFEVVPCYLTKDKRNKHVNLLLIQNEYYSEDEERSADDKLKSNENDEAVEIQYHYVWIKNLSRLVSSQLATHHSKKFICDRCLHYFYSQAQLNIHEKDCVLMNECAIKLPKPGDVVEFRNFTNKEKVPFVVYSDIESLLLPTNDKRRYQKHEPCTIGYYLKCSYDDSKSFYKAHTGKNCTEWFVNEMVKLAEDLQPIFLNDKPMDPLTHVEEHDFITATNCHICSKRFEDSDVKVRDHNHITGKYRGAAHSGCNLNFRDKDNKTKIPIIFHNFSGYDSHFIIKNLASDIEGRIDLLPISKEKYISYTKYIAGNIIKFRFIDSYRFMASSLDKLAADLPYYPILKSEFAHLKEEDFNLLTRKGVFPYEYLDSWEKLDETCLPTIEKFHSKLNNSDIRPEDYTHAINVWKIFEINNLREYTELYMKTDILLLADVFEKFRSCMLSTHKLDPCHYYTLPGFTWDAMLHFTNVILELISDIEMLMFIERGIRGGLSQCSKRYAKANNKHMSTYDVQKEIYYLIYFDVNNQYGDAMRKALPYGGFEWLKEIDNFDINTIAEDAPKGYILEVDLEYPHHLHDNHSDLPFCPEHAETINCKDKKLVATLHDKERYVIHYLALKEALKNGLVLKKIHRILTFKQSTWLKPYIDLNNNLRTAAKNEFEKNLYKLMNNAVFGKTMENVRKYSNVKLKTQWGGRFGAEALISSPKFKSSLICDENLVIIEMGKTEIIFNKPIYVGMSILDIAKISIYKFHYDYMKSKLGANARVCYTDTDSLIYEIKNDDIYDSIKKNAMEQFDTSDYPLENIYNIPLVNKKVLGLMKDENNGRVMTEFVGLRSKMYATRVEDKDKDKKSKGVKNNIIKNQICFADYLDCLMNNAESTVEQHLIRSKKHNVETIIQTKIALSPHDTKRYICKDGINTLAWGHYSIIN